MATIYPNRKDGKIISVKLKAYLGRDEQGKQIFRCKNWIPEKDMTEKKLLELAEKEAILFEYEAAAKYEEERKAFKPNEILFNDFVQKVWFPEKINPKEVRATTITFHSCMLKIILPYFEGQKLKDITDKHIERYLSYLKNTYRTRYNTRLAPKTIRHHYGTLSLIFGYALKLD